MLNSCMNDFQFELPLNRENIMKSLVQIIDMESIRNVPPRGRNFITLFSSQVNNILGYL